MKGETIMTQMTHDEIARWAAYLEHARSEAKEQDRITSTFPGLSMEDAYRIQDEGIRLRIARGEKIVGYKMGLTSRAKREQMGLHSPVYGVLTDEMWVKEGQFNLAGKIHPKIEPEIAFLVSRELKGRVSREEALDACSGVCAALEILDSRYMGFKYFSLPDVVADNSSSSYFVLGDWIRDFRTLCQSGEVARLAMTMSVNGVVAQKAESSEISGDPVNSLLQLCELMSERGLSVPAGSVVLAGAATVAVALEPGMKISLSVRGAQGSEWPGAAVQVL